MTSTPRTPRPPDSGPESAPSQVLRLRTPGDLLAFLPYQLGYHPRRSVVVVCWHQRRLGLVQRADLPEDWEVEEALDVLLPVLFREDPSAVTLVGYEDIDGESHELLGALADECVDGDIQVRDQLVVCRGFWRSLACTDPSCCPPGGSRLPDPAQVPAAVEMVARGVRPALDRAGLADRLTGTRPLLERAVAAEAEQLQAVAPRPWEATRLVPWRDQALAAWARVLGVAADAGPDAAVPVASLPPGDLARAAVSLVDVEVRDALIAWLTPGNLPFELVDPDLLAQVRRHLSAAGGADDEDRGRVIEQRLVELCAALPAAWAVAPLTVLATHSWWRGDGALARVAVERALASDPAYRLAQLLLQMIDHAVRPERAAAAAESAARPGPPGTAA
ncbi:MAG TPA: DUF4192 domain-containing protein [Segeticoccus sp.]|uniref:DUF4192 domain-containing protein n=1 Tax=Segeticoccus sp. TaxID=2706531 RepID=UPI002D7E3F67|nr:DUF4192 domain-containing protein [Segeticoccus sp.]HET8602078.1 DUF4192 domain-containing protein [Segeticoccus sp.]